MDSQIIKKLKEIANRPVWELNDDTIVEDFVGGNVDDAFEGGVRCGEVYLAQELLTQLGETWN